MLQQTRGLHRPELIRGSVESFRRLFKLPPFLLGVAGSRGGTGEDQSANDVILGRMKAVRERAVGAQLIHHVEMYYETSMTAFVGYVNALVVENGILDELPKAILTQKHIMDADASVLEKIAGEKPSEARQREKDNRELEVLKKALETLEGYSTG
ncbi:hypothetical protein QBC46DRAFT_92488 [Diplogelasinospora grovesii]|uniref:GED domain-containing protein n=1 Tax=Diplogelasinospora grovesii TaxID=303347 RepID=A0AAN6MY05_9PEZI|nr:hypothetical protein QBC46DRAFT_92488 [Diplogelasinospora grovesii]